MPSEKKNTTFSPLPTDDSKLESGEVLRKSYTDFNILGQPVSADMLIERCRFLIFLFLVEEVRPMHLLSNPGKRMSQKIRTVI